MTIDKWMKEKHGAVQSGCYIGAVLGDGVTAYENKQTQQRFLVEVIDGAARVYSYCGEVGSRD